MISENDKKVVLVVDDSPSIRREVKAILEQDDYIVREAANEYGMLNTIEEYGKIADVVLMDIVLKAEEGFDLVLKLKSIKKYENIPVLMLTEHADRIYVQKAKFVGVQGYILKPINADLLISRLKEALKENGIIS